MLSRFCPCPGHEFVDAAVRPIGGDFLHDVGDLGEGFDVVKLAGFYDGIDRGGALASGLRAGEQPVAPSDGDAALGDEIVDLQSPVIEITGQRQPASA